MTLESPGIEVGISDVRLNTLPHPALLIVEEWGRILGDEVMAAALLDRHPHRPHVVNIRGNGYRIRRHADLSKAINAGAARDVSPPGASAW